ncbi:MAG: hypothetical protein JRI57_06650 [Deltaproteobacteria bacterium]|nr:hypothetical protein [Deltaproteobacteria bacterium]MBW1952838.1 hypothetical protein [Deltaproteobacteria bacterium]MBW1986770.1 hypothetical protein [Deltaproteobacteria bacterium]MBW2135274.1 hypothetical protein [Deltaproteobacteria bacterium]
MIFLVSGFTLLGVTLGETTFSEVYQKYPGGNEKTSFPDPMAETLEVKKVYSSADQRLHCWFNATV